MNQKATGGHPTFRRASRDNGFIACSSPTERAVSRMSESGYGINSLMRWDMDGETGWPEDKGV